MKELLSAFHGDVFRPLITLFIPGCIAVSTWFVALFQRESDLRYMAKANLTETGLLAAVIVVCAGMVLEDWGSRIEASILDKYENWSTKGLFLKEWKQYLLLVYVSEPVMRSYLRGLLIRMKFELDSTAAFVAAGLGSFFLTLPDRWVVWLHWGPFVAAGYLFYEAYKTHQLMGRARHDLLSEELRFVGTLKDQRSAARA